MFGLRVEDIFSETTPGQESEVWTADPDVQIGDRVIVANLGQQRIAHRASLWDGPSFPIATHSSIVSEVVDEHRVRIKGFPSRLDRGWTVISGCDPGLGLLANHLTTTRAENVFWRNYDNKKSLALLEQGLVHMAALHHPVHRGSQMVQPSGPNGCRRVHFASWELGWLVKRGNPWHFHGVDDLRSGKFRLVNRPLGAGARTLLDSLLAEAAVPSTQIPQYDWTVHGHMQVAMAIDAGAADVGIAVAGVAGALHLDFIPIQVESCDVWIPERNLKSNAVQQLLELVNSDVFRWDLQQFGSYDVSKTGLTEDCT